MAKRGFSVKDREKALKLMANGVPQSEVAEQIGCSVFSLQAWKKKAKNGAQDKCEETPQCCLDNGCSDSAPPQLPKKGSADDFVRKFWNKNFRAVDMLLNPKDVSQEEAIKLVNEALLYAYEQFQK